MTVPPIVGDKENAPNCVQLDEKENERWCLTVAEEWSAFQMLSDKKCAQLSQGKDSAH